MYSIDSGKKEVILTIKNGNVIQNIRVPYEGASYYVKELLTSYYDLYERHKHVCKIRSFTLESGLKPTLDWRDTCNLIMESTTRHAFNAIQHGKADEKLISGLMDTVNYMFADIHSFYISVQD